MRLALMKKDPLNAVQKNDQDKKQNSAVLADFISSISFLRLNF
jgi:hypothetical protein